MIIGLVGPRGSGKSTVASHLSKAHGFVEVAFATPLKDGLAALFDVDRRLFDDPELKDAAHADLAGRTPRAVMQHVGTDVVRRTYGEDFFVERMRRRLDGLGASRVVVSDVRFPNEAALIRRLGGEVVFVRRFHPMLLGVHVSERSLLPESCDRTLDNVPPTSPAELRARVDQLLSSSDDSSASPAAGQSLTSPTMGSIDSTSASIRATQV